MRILFLSPGAYGVNGGIGLYDRDVVEALAEMPEVREIVLLPRLIQSDTGPLPEKVVHRTAAARGSRAFVLASLKELGGKFDLILCGHINLMPLACAMNWWLRAPMALLVYGIDVWEQPSRISRWVVGKADAVWSISDITSDRMNNWAGLDRSSYVLLPNAIHLDRYGEEGLRDAIRARHDLTDRKVLMTLARLPGFDRYKGVDETLECLASLRSRDPSIAYMVVGDGEDRSRLEGKAAALGVADHVRFVGHISEDEKADYYRAADLFVLPGRGEGFGFVFLEALACGVPAVGSCVDGSREALREGSLGEIPDPRDLMAVEAAIERGLRAPRGIPAGLDHFAWPAFQARVADATRALVVGVSK